MEKMRMESVDMTAQNIERIGELFPNCITETVDEHGNPQKAINFELLKQMLSGDVIEGSEAYEFTWVGKKAAIVEANRPIRKTLRPCKEESVNWDSTENLYIEGDNLEVLKLLQESYLGAVKMIYIDPPYNTGNDFVYADNFMHTQDTENRQMGMYDGDDNRLFKNTDSNGKFHSDWCSMMYSRLMLARNLLRNDGVIFISIDDNEYGNLKEMCDEVFGGSCYIASFIWDGGRKNDSKRVSVSHEYILAYGKVANIDYKDDTIWKERKDGIDEIYKTYEHLCMLHKNDWDMISAGLKKWYSSLPDSHPAKAHKHYCNADSEGVYFASDLSGPDDGRKSRPRYEVIHPVTGKPVPVPARGWRWEESRMKEELKNNRVHFGKDESSIPNGKVYLKENEWQAPSSVFYKDRRSSSNNLKKLLEEKVFDFPKDVSVMERLISFVCRDEDIVLDFFSGSGTIGEAVYQYNVNRKQNVRFILVQLPEKTKEDSKAEKAGYMNICEIGKERLRRAGISIYENAGIFGREKDFGFRVFKLDETNMTDVYYSANEYSQGMLATLESNVKIDRTDLDLLFGCLLDWGLPLSLPYSSETVEGCIVHTYNGRELIACFDENIPEGVIRTIAKRQPRRAVFRDSSFASSPSKINVGEVFKLLAPDTRVKVI